MHISSVQRNFRFIYAMFLVSEFRLFVSFFWAFFASSLTPTARIGQSWPPKGINVIKPLDVPLLNSRLLITSAITVTSAHKYLRLGQKKITLFYFKLTIRLGLMFTQIQMYEFKLSNFSISDSIFGTCFFSLTGLHAFHVIRGTFFLMRCHKGIKKNVTTKEDHFFIESSLWYWHFVDIVWIALFFIVYIWGGFGLRDQGRERLTNII